MVLDTYEPDKDLFIFKNTYNDEASGQPKQFKIKRTDPNAPEELFFVHIDIRDMDNLPSQEQREANKEAEIEKKKRMFQSTRETSDGESSSQEESTSEDETELESEQELPREDDQSGSLHPQDQSSQSSDIDVETSQPAPSQ